VTGREPRALLAAGAVALVVSGIAPHDRLTWGLLIRRSPLRPGKWPVFLVLCVCLAISATYELFEWWTAVIGGESAEAFLGTQGDQWDTQWDMFMALVGAATAQVLLGRLHDRQIARREEQSHG